MQCQKGDYTPKYSDECCSPPASPATSGHQQRAGAARQVETTDCPFGSPHYYSAMAYTHTFILLLRHCASLKLETCSFDCDFVSVCLEGCSFDPCCCCVWLGRIPGAPSFPHDDLSKFIASVLARIRRVGWVRLPWLFLLCQSIDTHDRREHHDFRLSTISLPRNNRRYKTDGLLPFDRFRAHMRRSVREGYGRKGQWSQDGSSFRHLLVGI